MENFRKWPFLPGGGRAVRCFFRIGVRVVIISVGVAVSKYGYKYREVKVQVGLI